ncbi:hypothetical protein H4219_005274 [Mycoemilia scoparia]|uniref:Uncharacterized protein n=1 Tax=Mycoemilia scoparia TaxID=417184 RepID=A0A9W7ZTM5_9FUNG|nr:hypothetical protein H4219_005274 [Mycoemilia scoparia]
MNPTTISKPSEDSTAPNSLNMALGSPISPPRLAKTPVHKKPAAMLTPPSSSSQKSTCEQNYTTTAQTPLYRRKSSRRNGDVLAGFYQGPAHRKILLPTPPRSTKPKPSDVHNKREICSNPAPVFSLSKRMVHEGQKCQGGGRQCDEYGKIDIYFDVFADTKRAGRLLEENFDLSIRAKLLSDEIADVRGFLSETEKLTMDQSIEHWNSQASRGKLKPDLPRDFGRIESIASMGRPSESALNYEMWLKCGQIAKLVRNNLFLKSRLECLSRISDDLSSICSKRAPLD